MKKIFIYTLFLFIFYSANGQYLATPNASFENWSGSPLTPDSWTASVQNTITRVSPGVYGSYAAKGAVTGVSPNIYTPTLSSQSGGFPVSQTYTYLQFYYKDTLASGGGGTDVFKAQITIYDASSVAIYHDIGGGTITTNNFSNFVAKQVHLYPGSSGGPPTKAIITFTVQPTGTDPNPHLGTWFIVDSVSLTNTALIGINEIEESTRLQIFPNPTHAYLNIKVDAIKPMQIKLSDVVGRVLVNRISESPVNGYIQDTINTESLSSGLYFLILTSDKKTILRRVIVD